jgi:hypothetical protein
MKRATRGAALVALVLATITGCSVQHDGRESLAYKARGPGVTRCALA